MDMPKTFLAWRISPQCTQRTLAQRPAEANALSVVLAMPAEVDALTRYPAEANALNVRWRDVLVEVDAQTRVCTALLIVALAPHGGRKGQENYTASRAP